MSYSVNIVFHRLPKVPERCLTAYDIDVCKADSLVRAIDTALNKQGCLLHVFLDDGYAEHYEFATTLYERLGKHVVLGIVQDDVGMGGYMTWDQIKGLAFKGHTIASHGVSHAALGIYENDTVLQTPAGGRYRNMPKGKAAVLTEEEVAYQVIESHRALTAQGIQIDDFVYPYGIFNQEVRAIVARSGLYARAYTCEESVAHGDGDQFAIARVVIDQSLEPHQWVARLVALVEAYKDGRRW